MPMLNADEFALALPPADEALEDLAFELATAVTGLAVQLNPVLRASVADLMRRVNCYYSHQLAGHELEPLDIESAVAGQLSSTSRRRRQQLAAVAHIELQRSIDIGADPPANPTSASYLEWLYCGLGRRQPDVAAAGSHVLAPDAGARDQQPPASEERCGLSDSTPRECAAVLQQFEAAYDVQGRLRGVMAAGAAYQRLLRIRPFFEGNGRIGRLMAYALLTRLGLRPSLWPLARGLARQRDEYDVHLRAAGMGARAAEAAEPLSSQLIVRFCRFFLSVCLEQVRYQESVLAVDHLLQRIQLFCAQETAGSRLPSGAFPLLRELVLHGEVERHRVSSFVGSGPAESRTWAAQHLTAALLNRGLIVADAPRAPFRLGLSAHVVDRWFPALYPALSTQSTG